MTIDPNHTAIEFAVTYAMNSIIKGRFHEFSGTLLLDADNPSGSYVSVQIDAGSLDSGSEQRDEQLRSDAFFDIESHEALTFESTSVELAGDNHWQVHGNLSMLNVTRPVTLDTHYYGIVEDATSITRAGFVSETDIRRSDWGMDWNAEQDTGVLVSDRVRIALFVSAIPVDDESDDDEDDSEWAPR